MEISEEALQDIRRASWLEGFKAAWDDRGATPLSAVRENPYGWKNSDEDWVYAP